MKKMLSLLLALTLILTAAFALAEGETEPAETTEPAPTLELDRNTMTGTTEVSLTVDKSMDSYTVIIPSKVTIDPKPQYGYGDVVLKAGWELVTFNRLKVQLTEAENGISDNYYNTPSSLSYSDSYLQYFMNFTLKNETKNAYYAIKASNLPWPFSKTRHNNGTPYEEPLISVSKGNANTSDKVSKLTFYVKTMPVDPGVYTDTLTFSIITQ